MIKTVIADDEKVIRNGLKKLLDTSGFPLELAPLAANGKEAVEIIKEVLPQIVLMDINMPGVKGLDVIEIVKPYIPDAKIIIISGHDDFHYAKRALQLGAFDYLLKPINRTQLCDAIRKAIDQLPTILPIANDDASSTKLANGNSIANKAIDFIKENYRDREINLSTLSKMFHVSESYMTRIIKQKISKSFSAYITDLRIEEAINLLNNRNDIMIGQIAEIVGYSSHHYFCRVFKIYTGLSPLEYKHEHKK